MPSYAYDVDSAEPSQREWAPSREEIDSKSDTAVLKEMQITADENEIHIRTQLEFFTDCEPGMRARRVTALSFWRVAIMHIKRRRNEIHSEARKA